MIESSPRELIIIGGGPAGYASALYSARAGLDPLVIEGFQPGGQLQNTTDVENYPGRGDPVMGPDLVQEMRSQAASFGAEFVTDDAVEIRLGDDERHSIVVDQTIHRARALILAMGSAPRELGVPGERELLGKGVSTCAVCDGAFFRGRSVAVVGGGDSAFEEALYLSRLAERVSLIHRRDDFRASRVMLERASADQRIELLTPLTVDRFNESGGSLSSIQLRDARNGSELDLSVDGAFVAIGHTPRSELVAGQLELDQNGCVIVADPSTETSAPGVFAVGDLADGRYRQAVTAAASGVRGALDAERWLQSDRRAL